MLVEKAAGCVIEITVGETDGRYCMPPMLPDTERGRLALVTATLPMLTPLLALGCHDDCDEFCRPSELRDGGMLALRRDVRPAVSEDVRLEKRRRMTILNLTCSLAYRCLFLLL